MAKCITPFYHKNNGYSFPCGKCVYCKKRRAAGWSFRLLHHLKKNPLASFVTLTYNTDHVPITPKHRMSLEPKDVQLFLKRLRTIQERKEKELFEKGIVSKYYGKKISYYLAGEYGSRYSRPHYHLIIFNANPTYIIKAWTNPKNSQSIGSLYFGNVTSASVGYTLKYISKEAKIPQYKGDDRVPEFQRMSKGIGLSYVTDNMVKWHLTDLFDRYYGQLPQSEIKVSLPRYYTNRIYTSLERTMIGEALQSKELETVHWGSNPQDVDNLIRKNPQEYNRLQYEKLKMDTLINNQRVTNDKIF